MITVNHIDTEERMRQGVAQSRLFLCKKIGKARFCYLLTERNGTLSLLVEYKDDERRSEGVISLPADPPTAERLCRALAARRATPSTLETVYREIAQLDNTAS